VTLSRLSMAALLFLAFFVVHLSTFRRLAIGAFTVEEGHIVFIMAIAGYMVWQRRADLCKPRSLLPPAWEVGAIVALLAACIIFLAGKLTGTRVLQDISLVVTLLTIVLFVFGPGHFKIVWMPIGYLVFAFPLFDEILNPQSIHFQMATARIASLLLGTTGMDVVLEGTMLHLPHISLEVAPACSGINHVIALTALAVPLAFLHQRTFPRKALLVVSAFFIGLFINGARVAVIGVYSAFTGGEGVHGPNDIFYVSSVFIAGLALLLVVDGLLRRKAGNKSDVSREVRVVTEVGVPPMPRKWPKRPIIVSLAVLFLTGGYLSCVGSRPLHLSRSLSDFAPVIGDWRAQANGEKAGVLQHVPSDARFYRLYRNDKGDEMAIEIAWFASQDESKKIISHATYFLHEHEQDFAIPLNGVNRIKKTRVMENRAPKLAYFWYDIHGTTVCDRYRGKWIIMKDALLKGRTDGAIVVISVLNHAGRQVGATDDRGAAFVSAAFPLVKSFLGSG
jgi:EpsI family protein